MESSALWMAGVVVALSACSAPTSNATSTLPTALVPDLLAMPTGEATYVLRVRVYAGVDYRVRSHDWRGEVERTVAAASGILQRGVDARLELIEVIEWKRSGGELDKTLTTLRLLDPGTDADLVIGFIDAPTKQSDTLAELVAYDLLGKHLVLRSYARQAESEALGSALAALSEAAHERLLTKRAHHKQSVLLVGAIAHLLGADDASLEEFVDAPTYAPQQHRLSDGGIARLGLTIPALLRDEPASWPIVLQKLQAEAASVRLISRVEERLVHDKGTQAEAPVASSILREVDRERLQYARSLLASRKGHEAWTQIEKLLELYPEATELFVPACESALLRGASDARKHCLRATEAHPEIASAWIALAASQTEPGEVKQSLDHASALLGKEPDAKRDDWGALARAYQKASLPRAAERAAKRGGPDSVLTWVGEMQARYGTSIGVEEASEAQYLGAVMMGLKYVYASDMKRAKESADSLARSFPSSIGSALVQCEILLRQRHTKAAATACREVLARHPDNSWAHYLLGLLDAREGKNVSAIQFLEKAIAVDPTLKAAYQTLSKIYTRSKDPRLEDVKARYKARFHNKL